MTLAAMRRHAVIECHAVAHAYPMPDFRTRVTQPLADHHRGAPLTSGSKISRYDASNLQK